MKLPVIRELARTGADADHRVLELCSPCTISLHPAALHKLLLTLHTHARLLRWQELMQILEEYWSRTPALHNVPIYTISGIAAGT